MTWLPSSMSSAFADPEQVAGLMARRSPEPEPGVLYTPLVNGHVAISTLHLRGELLVVVPPPWISPERII